MDIITQLIDQLTNIRLYVPFYLLGAGFLNWAYLLVIDYDDPGPLLLQLTFFATIGIPLQVINDSMLKAPTISLFVFFMLAVLLATFQIIVYKKQSKLTLDNLSSVLREKLFETKKVNKKELQNWIRIGAEYIKVDFFPSFYKTIYKKYNNKSGPRVQKREEFIELLKTKIHDPGISQENFEVPQETRKVWWFWYVAICVTSWVVYIWVTISSCIK